MAEAEEVLLEGARFATAQAAALWRRHRGEPPGPPALIDVQARLELYVAALCPGAPPIGVSEPPAVPHLLARWMKRIPAHLVEREALASTDGARIRLPRRLDRETQRETLALYRLLALEQALRATRETPRHLPAEALLRDLFLLSEAATVDVLIARRAPGLLPALIEERARALAKRPAAARLTAPEQKLEAWLCALLAAPPDPPPAPFIRADSPSDSLAWAEDARRVIHQGSARYRGLSAVPLWGQTRAPSGGRWTDLPAGEPSADPPPASDRSRVLSRRPKVREAEEDEDDEGDGMMMVPIQDRQEKAEDPMGLTRPIDRDDHADPDDLAESLAELAEARIVRTPERPREVLLSDDPPARQPMRPARRGSIAGVTYPEWDFRRGTYRLEHVVVRVGRAPAADLRETADLERRNARLVAAVRRRFERIRPSRIRLGRQRDGPEIDMDAVVTAMADLRAGGWIEDRLYQIDRPLRRELAIALLVDVSASTDSWVSGRRRIIDVERDAVLVVSEALEVLGDRYAILAFSGEGPSAVRVMTVKDYGHRYDGSVRRRIAALEPDRYTRLGAAIRHTTAGLAREAARHRLMLVLSDGKPNDFDEYEGPYGVEDARQAVAEARLQQIRPFCLTVDRHAPHYMPRIFGSRGFSVLRDAEALPRVMADVVRRLIAV